MPPHTGATTPRTPGRAHARSSWRRLLGLGFAHYAHHCDCSCAWKNRSSTPFRQVCRSLRPHTTFRKRIIFSKRTDANLLVDVVYKTGCPCHGTAPRLSKSRKFQSRCRCSVNLCRHQVDCRHRQSCLAHASGQLFMGPDRGHSAYATSAKPHEDDGHVGSVIPVRRC
jgi:hypothetical protein